MSTNASLLNRSAIGATRRRSSMSQQTLAILLAAISRCARSPPRSGFRSGSFPQPSGNLYAVYQHWTARDFGVNPEHPPLAKLVAALPLLNMNIKPSNPPRFLFLAEEYAGGEQMLAENGNYRLLTRARIAASFFTFALALLLFAAGWEMFGPSAGLLALTLFNV